MTANTPPQEQDWAGWAKHVHHACESPIEYCTSYQERRRAILTSKPAEEHALRLARLQPVSSELPPALVQAGATFVKARAAYLQARDAVAKARAAYLQARDAVAKARAAYLQAGDAFDTARDAYLQAGDAFDTSLHLCLPELVAIHDQECTPTGCLWTPQHPSIFPGEVQL